MTWRLRLPLLALSALSMLTLPTVTAASGAASLGHVVPEVTFTSSGGLGGVASSIQQAVKAGKFPSAGASPNATVACAGKTAPVGIFLVCEMTEPGLQGATVVVRIDAANGTRFTFVDIGTGLCSPVLPKAEYLGLLRIGYCKPPPAPPPLWAGLGGSYAAWQAAHQPYSDTCPVGDCYGKDVNVGGEANSRFVEVDYSEITRVVGQYWQAIGDGTPIERAERNVAALLPADAITTRRFVQHDHNDDICVLWDLKSKTLQTLVGKNYAGQLADPGGVIGVVLEEIPNARPNQPPTNGQLVSTTQANFAMVYAHAVDRSTNCDGGP